MGRFIAMWNRRLCCYAIVCCTGVLGACGGSVFPSVEFPTPPSNMGDDPSGGFAPFVRGTITFYEPAAADEEGPKQPYVVIRRQWRAMITGEPNAGLTSVHLQGSPVELITLARARLARPDEEPVVVDALETDSEGANIPSSGEVVLKLPDVRPGDLVDVVWEKRLLAPELLEPWVFAVPAVAAESTLEVVYPRQYDVRLALGEGGTANRGANPTKREIGDDRLSRTWTEYRVPAVPPESHSFHPQRGSPWATVVLAKARFGDREIAYADTWKTVAQRVNALLKTTTAIDDEARAEMSIGLTKARVRALRKRLKPQNGEVRLLHRQPRSFVELTSSPPGPLEASALAAALAEGSMENAYVALVAPFEGPVLIDELPGLYAFRHAVVAVDEGGGGWQFADPTCATCVYGRLPLEAAGGRALILSDSPRVVEIPLRTVEANRRNMQFDWVLSVDGNLTGVFVADLEGTAAQRARVALSSTSDDESRFAALGKVLWGPDSGIFIEELVEEGDLLPGEAYTLRLKVRTEAKTEGQSVFQIRPKQIAGESLPWRLLSKRQTGVLLPAPARLEVTSTLQLPPSFKAEPPSNLQEKLSMGEYSAHFQKSGLVVTYVRRVGLYARAVPADVYVRLADLLERARALDNNTITVRGD